MKTYRSLGIDPGIANTGLAIVESDGSRYALLKTRLVTSSPKERETERLLHIFNNVQGLLNEFRVDNVAIEKVYHNKNVSSSIKTGKAIGAAMVGVATHASDVVELTPQQVKRASGLSSRANKENIIRAVRHLFGVEVATHHEADAALCGLAGCLSLRANAKR